MKVIISVSGRFHAFYLAQQLAKRCALKQLITSYPKFEVVKYGIPKYLVTSLLSNELLSRGWARFPKSIKSRWNPQFFFSERFDYLASQRIKFGADIFVGWSNVSLKTMRVAKKLGMIGIIERGSSHILYQDTILREENARYGLKAGGIHPKIIEKELREYDEADYIEVPSNFSKKTFTECEMPDKKVIVNNLCVDVQEFHPSIKEDSIFRVIHCGGISLRKGVHYLLQAFHELRLPQSELWLIGAIDEDIKVFLKKYSSPNIFIKGPFRQQQLYEYYSQGSVFCLASLGEGFAMVILQAMACGLPVICFDKIGAQDVIRDGQDGFIVTARDIDALKEKIVYMYKNPQLCQGMGREARERVAKNFTWDDYGERTAHIYNNLLI